jgi:putative ABC transport system permease protein
MRVVSAVLSGVSASDPLIYVAVAIALTLVALLSSYLPARAAARLDPMLTLQAE